MPGKTYLDFPEFYAHPFIKSIADKEKWSVSDNTKRPIDMKAWIYEKRIYGARMDDTVNPCVSLSRLCSTIPDAANHAYYLNAIADKFVVLDIEPKCPEDIKQNLLNTGYIYGEISLSGQGFHLVHPLPDCFYEYPVLKKKIVMKESHGYYEILLNHWVTFTRNMIGPARCQNNIFENIFRELAANQKEVVRTDIDVNILKPENIHKEDYLLDVLSHCAYSKTPDDFDGDISKYEYGCIGFLYWNLNRLLTASYIKAEHEYSPNEITWLLYEAAKAKIPYRAKHDEFRDNLPWLLYLSREIIAKSDLTPKTRKE